VGAVRNLIEPGGNFVMTRLVRTGREEIIFAVIALKDLCVIGWSPRIYLLAPLDWNGSGWGAGIEGMLYSTDRWRDAMYSFPSLASLSLLSCFV